MQTIPGKSTSYHSDILPDLSTVSTFDATDTSEPGLGSLDEPGYRRFVKGQRRPGTLLNEVSAGRGNGGEPGVHRCSFRRPKARFQMCFILGTVENLIGVVYVILARLLFSWWAAISLCRSIYFSSTFC